MEIHQLRYFEAVARTGSFTAAAADCHVSQPTLSQQVKKLEDELGEPLLARGRDGATLTALGESFLPRARRILAEVRASEEEAAGFSGVIRGRVRVGAIPTIAPYVLPALVRDFAKAHPGCQIEVTEDTTDSLVTALFRGQVDLALASPPLPGEGWEEMRLIEEPLRLALPAKHPLARKAKVSAADLSALPLVLLHERHCLSRQTLDACAHARGGPVSQVLVGSAQLETVHALVEAGLGYCLTPEMAVTNRPGLRFLPAPGAPTRRVSAFWMRTASFSKATERFVELLRKAYPLGA